MFGFGFTALPLSRDNSHERNHRAIQQCMLHMSSFCLVAFPLFSSFPFPAHFPFPQEDGDVSVLVMVPFFPFNSNYWGGGGCRMQRVINQNLIKQGLSITGIQWIIIKHYRIILFFIIITDCPLPRMTAAQ